MGGVVSDVVSGVGDAVSGVGNAVVDTASGLGKTIENFAKSDLGKASLLAGGAYLAAPLVAESLGAGAASTGTGITAGSTGLGLTGAGTTAAGGLGAGIGSSIGLGAGEAAGAGLAGSTVGGLGLGAGTAALGGIGAGLGTSAAVGGLGAATGGSLLGGMGGWGTALGAAALGSKLLGGGTPSSSTTTTSIDPQVKEAYLRNLEEARATAAGLAPRQFAAFPEYNLGMVQKYMNPYEQQVVQNTLADIERARQMQIAQEGAQATAAKAFGGSRQGVTRSLVDEAALRNAGNLAAQLRQQGFTQAQNLGLSQEALRQQYEQQKLDALRNLGLERLNVAQGALSLQPANIGGTSTTPIYKNQLASSLGGALGGASLGSLFGGTSGAQMGALAGGLLGFL